MDAFRHAYVSGVMTQEFGANTANFLGILQELSSFGGGSIGNTPEAKNMDYWNNEVGRKYGKKTTSRLELAKNLHQALRNGEMITDLDSDTRKYSGNMDFKSDPKKPVEVLREDATGRNELFIDTQTWLVMSREDFVAEIKSEKYQGYYLTDIDGVLTPVSKPDASLNNNLG